MKNILKRVLILLLCLCMMSSVVTVASAASVGKVASLKTTDVTTKVVKLSWSKVKNAKGYCLYKYDYSAKAWKLLKNTSAQSYSDSGMNPGTRCAYKVRAYILSGSKKTYGAYSSTLYAVTYPNDIGAFKADSSTENSVTLSWGKTTGATGYRLYLYNRNLKKYEKVTDTTKLTYTVKGLAANTNYAFKVRPYVKSGSLVRFGNPSSTLINKTMLATVSGLTLTKITNSSFAIKWDAVKGATGYQLMQYDTTSKTWNAAQYSGDTSYYMNELPAGMKYTLKVRAYVESSNGTIFGSYSPNLIVCSLPATPTGLVAATNADSGISLTWNKVTGASGYQIYRYNSQNGTWVDYKTVSTNSFNDNNLKDTGEYTYKIRAYIRGTSEDFYGDFCGSVSHFFESTKEPDNYYSAEMTKSGVLGYLYDPKEGCFYTSSDPWQRNFGFNEIYDMAAPYTLLIYDTVRLKFTSGSKDWMIQLWKGQYGLVFYGGEIGVYTKPSDRNVEHYDCAKDSDMLKISMSLYKKNLFGKWKEEFNRPYGTYWWCTGFVPGNRGVNFDEIKLDIRITMKDYNMLNGMKKALEDNKIEYTVKGLDVYFEYATD